LSHRSSRPLRYIRDALDNLCSLASSLLNQPVRLNQLLEVSLLFFNGLSSDSILLLFPELDDEGGELVDGAGALNSHLTITEHLAIFAPYCPAPK